MVLVRDVNVLTQLAIEMVVQLVDIPGEGLSITKVDSRVETGLM
jgi:hypothetical protein